MPIVPKRLPVFSEDFKDYFLDRVKVMPSGCHEWQGTRGPKSGYGQVYVGSQRRIRPAHRVAYAIRNPDFDQNLFVLHKCDNRVCCNPDHLFLGDAMDNMRDRDLKGRGAKGDRHGSRTKPQNVPRGDRHMSRTAPHTLLRGESHPNSVVSEETVRCMRKLHSDGVSVIYIAKAYRVGRSCVCHIVSRRSWAHVD